MHIHNPFYSFALFLKTLSSALQLGFIRFQTSVKLKTHNGKLACTCWMLFHYWGYEQWEAFHCMHNTLAWTEHVKLPSSTGCECQESWIVETSAFEKAVLCLAYLGINMYKSEIVLFFVKEKVCRKRSLNLGSKPDHFCIYKWPNGNKHGPKIPPNGKRPVDFQHFQNLTNRQYLLNIRRDTFLLWWWSHTGRGCLK